MELGITGLLNLPLAGVLFYFLKVLFKEYKEERDRNNKREKETINALLTLQASIEKNTDTLERVNDKSKENKE